MVLVVLLIIFGAFLLFGLWRTNVRPREMALPTWRELASQLQPVHNEGIRALALDFLDPAVAKPSRSQAETWEMIGGVEGLKRMKENAEILIALASYAQRWNPDESVVVAERMRRDGLVLRRAVVGLGLGLTLGYGKARVLAYVLEAAGSYHLMRERLLVLYKTTHAGIHPTLEEAL